jgi:hypothetical protein
MSSPALFVDTIEAPAGYYPVSIDEIKDRARVRRNENRCHWCDYQPGCQATDTPVSCMAYMRDDGLNVVFKHFVSGGQP